MTTLNFWGCGRVGQTLGRLWQQCGAFTIQDVLTTTPASAQAACNFMGAGRPVSAAEHMRPADVWMMATPDAQIGEAAYSLARLAGQWPPAMAFHGSGALTAEMLAPLAALGWSTGSAHCILSFATAQAAVAQFPGTACALEGDAAVCALLQPAMQGIGAQCFGIASKDKVLYHAAAVFATNFLPVLQSLAEQAWHDTGVPHALLPALRQSLLSNAVANITALGPAGALTGPAARGDTAAIARQAQVVRTWDPQAGAAYEALSALALRMAKASKDTATTQAKTH